MTLHVEQAGSGRLLVLLHGFALHGGVFAGVVPAFARHRRVVVVDLPGHGASAPPARFDLDVIADAVADAAADAAADAVDPAAVDGPAAVDVLGWSFGGQVALAWALRRPDTVRRLVLACTTPTFVARPGFPDAMAAATLARFGDELAVAYRLTLQRFLTLQVQGSDAGRRALGALRTHLFERGTPAPATLAGMLALLAATDLRDALTRVSQPALVLAGPRDTLAPEAAGRWLAQALPAGRFRVIPGAAHAPFLSHAAEFVRATEEFLDGR